MKRGLLFDLSLLVILGVSACSPVPEPTATAAQSIATTEPALPTPSLETVVPTETEAPPTEAAPTEGIPVTGHLMTPADAIPRRVTLTYDVESAGTSAPYGDSYRINRFERPFEGDMTYVPDLDILRFEVGEDADWYYVSIILNGSNPSSPLGIHYGIEIDEDADGFGDFIIWASPPYTTAWATDNVQIFEDTDQDTAGRSSSQSEPGFEGNGYDTQLFDGGRVQSEDPDLAWVRMVEGGQAVVQLAFKRSWAGASFVIGVVSDAGIKDVSQYDYNDRFEASQAGSPLRNDPNYPLGPLYAVDNTCWQPYNLVPSNYQPKFCPPEVLPTATRRPSSNPQPIVTVPALSSTMPPVTSTDPPPATNTNPPPITDTNPPPPTDTSLPPPPPPPACTPEFDPGICDTYNPEICECE